MFRAIKVIGVVVLCFVLTACGDKVQKYSALSYDAKVLAFGDSVTFGYGVDPKDSYPSVLARLTGWNVMNAGISGERADQAKHRIDGLLAEESPQLVIIGLGGNDFLQRRNAQDVKEDLRAIIQSVKSSGAIPVLIAVPALSPMAVVTGKPKDSSIYAELAIEENINVISNVFSNVLADTSLKIDQIHPNPQGYQIFTQGIYDALKKMGL